MATMNWTEFDGEKFQEFCNDLLSFEFGKLYVPFSAPGPDQGIDGLFEGEYLGKEGKWRIQAKFHHPETGRTAGVNLLKRDVRKDLTSNIKDETAVVLITNVEINPKQKAELLRIAEESLAGTNANVDFDIWDGAKINTLLAHHPLLKLWYTRDAKHLIQEYSEFYAIQVSESLDKDYNFSNRFYFRQDAIRIFHEFFEDPEMINLIISGEPGIGKTRLCIEFFRTYIDNTTAWVALTLVSHNLDFQIIQSALSGEKNYILLVDDADKFDEKEIADLITLTSRIKPNKVKLVFTVRDYFESRLLDAIPTSFKSRHTERLKLNHLSPQETAEFLQQELQGRVIEGYLSSFIELTRGVPILIHTLIGVIRADFPLKRIKQDQFLVAHVEGHFKKFVQETSKKLEVTEKGIRKILDLFALIEPITISDPALIEGISTSEEVNKEDVGNILLEMKSNRIIAGKYIHEIKPDLYSDLLLRKSLSRSDWLERKVAEYGQLISNIIKNINYAIEDHDHSDLLENLLNDYVIQIDSSPEVLAISRTLDTIIHIVYTKPDLAVMAVEKTIAIYHNQDHPLHREFQQAAKSKAYGYDSTITRLKMIIRSLFNLDDYFHFAYDVSLRLYATLKDEGLITNIANFERSDYLHRFDCTRQNRILREAEIAYKSDVISSKLFGLRSIRSILTLEFNSTEAHPYENYKLNLYTIVVPENKSVKKLRLEAINFLQRVFENEEHVEVYTEALRIILDVPRMIFSVRKKSYEGKDEIESVIHFLLRISSRSKLSLHERQNIKKQLYWYQRWGLEEAFAATLMEIDKNLSSGELTEILLDLLSPEYDLVDNHEQDDFAHKALGIISEYEISEIGDALVLVVEQSEYPPHFLFPFLDLLSQDLVRTKGFVEFFWETNRDFLMEYCFGLLSKLRLSENYEPLYWQFANNIKEVGSAIAIRCLLRVYDPYWIFSTDGGTISVRPLSKEDAKLVVSVFEESTNANSYELSSTLPTLFTYDRKLAVEIIAKFLRNCIDRDLDNLFFILVRIKDEYYDEIKEILLKHTKHLNITYRVEEFIDTVIRKGEFREVMQYLEERFLFQRRELENNRSLSGYKFVPSMRAHVITKSLPDHAKVEIFSHVLRWFVQFDFKSYERYQAKQIVSLFSPKPYIDEEVKEVFLALSNEFKTLPSRLTNLVVSLSEFHDKNGNLVEVLTRLLALGLSIIEGIDELNEYKSQCYISLTSVGVKSGTSGQPFAVDLKMRDLLDQALANPKMKSPGIRQFYQKALNSVNKEIASATEEEGGELW